MAPCQRSALWKHVRETGPQKWMCPGCHETKSGALLRVVAHLTGEGCTAGGIAACKKREDMPEAAREAAEQELQRINKERDQKVAAAGIKTVQPRLTEAFSGEFSRLADQAPCRLVGRSIDMYRDGAEYHLICSVAW